MCFFLYVFICIYMYFFFICIKKTLETVAVLINHHPFWKAQYLIRAKVFTKKIYHTVYIYQGQQVSSERHANVCQVKGMSDSSLVHCKFLPSSLGFPLSSHHPFKTEHTHICCFSSCKSCQPHCYFTLLPSDSSIHQKHVTSQEHQKYKFSYVPDSLFKYMAVISVLSPSNFICNAQSAKASNGQDTWS